MLIASIICIIGLSLCYISYQQQRKILDSIKFRCAIECINNEVEYYKCVEYRYKQTTQHFILRRSKDGSKRVN